MKSFKFALLVASVAVSAIVAYSFLGNDPENNTEIAKAKDISDPTKVKPSIAKPNSFSTNGVGQINNGIPSSNEIDIVQARNFLASQVDNRLKQLGSFKSRLENTLDIDYLERTSLISQVNAQMENFVALKPDIKKCETKDEIRKVAEKFKAEWLEGNKTLDRGEKLMFAALENQLISDANSASTGLKKRIEVLKASGKNTENHEKLLNQYSEKIASAKQGIEASKAKYEAIASAASDGQKNQLLKEKDQLSKDAHEDIRQAYKLLTEEARKEFSQRYQ